MPRQSPGKEDLSFFSALPPAARSSLDRLFTTAQYKAGSTIFHEGESVDRVFLVRQGRVALEMAVPGRARQRILSLGPGELLGWSPLVGGPAMVASAIAIEDCQLASAPALRLRELCDASPEVGYYFMGQLAKALAQRLIATRLQLLDLFRQDSQTSSTAEGGNG